MQNLSKCSLEKRSQSVFSNYSYIRSIKMSQIDCKVGAIIPLFLIWKNYYILRQIWDNLRQKLGQKWAFSAVFYYRRIGQLGRIFGRIISAEFGRIFGRIFGIGRTLVFMRKKRGHDVHQRSSKVRKNWSEKGRCCFMPIFPLTFQESCGRLQKFYVTNQLLKKARKKGTSMDFLSFSTK